MHHVCVAPQTAKKESSGLRQQLQRRQDRIVSLEEAVAGMELAQKEQSKVCSTASESFARVQCMEALVKD